MSAAVWCVICGGPVGRGEGICSPCSTYKDRGQYTPQKIDRDIIPTALIESIARGVGNWTTRSPFSAWGIYDDHGLRFWRAVFCGAGEGTLWVGYVNTHPSIDSDSTSLGLSQLLANPQFRIEDLAPQHQKIIEPVFTRWMQRYMMASSTGWAI